MFQNLYKRNIDKSKRQEERRQQLLQLQKEKRLQDQDEYRQFSGSVGRKGCHYHSKRNINSDIANINLQLSEWLKDKPKDFSDWFIVPCPKGQRCLVVSSKGETKMYSKNKRYCMSFTSLLPGGGSNGSIHDSCILDCIYNKELDKFYVLDAIHYSIPLKDCETEFRFFWLKSKFTELEDAAGDYRDDNNTKNITLLEYYNMANEEHLTQALQKYPLWPNNEPQLDGFLFYHKESHYIYGYTPLVCWLFPFMVPDFLELPVSGFYEAPKNYSKENPWQYMGEFDKELARKHSRRKIKPVQDMDLQEIIVKDQSAITMDEDAESENEVQEDNLLQTILTAEKKLELEG